MKFKIFDRSTNLLARQTDFGVMEHGDALRQMSGGRLPTCFQRLTGCCEDTRTRWEDDGGGKGSGGCLSAGMETKREGKKKKKTET